MGSIGVGNDSQMIRVRGESSIVDGLNYKMLNVRYRIASARSSPMKEELNELAAGIPACSKIYFQGIVNGCIVHVVIGRFVVYRGHNSKLGKTEHRCRINKQNAFDFLHCLRL